jgi:hypothetical protein
MDKAELLARVADVRTKGQAAVASKVFSSYLSDPRNPMSRVPVSWVEAGLAAEFRAAGSALLEDIFGTDNRFYVDFLSYTSNVRNVYGFDQAAAVVKVVEELINREWLESTKGLLAAEVFADFLEMSQHLWEERYKDAAAVIAGSSLEAHLKRLSVKANVPLTMMEAKGVVQARKADTLNADLVKAGVYDKNEQKQVTAWLGVRNEAAHGNYANVNIDIVGQMITGIRLFVSRHPA